MRTALTLLCLLLATFLAFVSVPAGIAMCAAALGVGARVSVKDEEGFMALLAILAAAGVVAGIAQQVYYMLT